MKYKLTEFWINARYWVAIAWIRISGFAALSTFIMTAMVMGILKPHKTVAFCRKLKLNLERATEERNAHHMRMKRADNEAFDIARMELEGLKAKFQAAIESDDVTTVNTDGLFDEMTAVVDKLKVDTSPPEPEQSFLLMLKDAWVHAWNL